MKNVKNQKVESSNASEKKQVLNVVEAAEEVVDATIKAVTVNGPSLTLNFDSTFHSQVREWDADAEQEILHRETVESHVLFNLFHIYLREVGNDREYLINKVFSKLTVFYKKTGKVAEMPSFLEALLLGAKVEILHSLSQKEDEEIPRLRTIVIVDKAEKPIPQLLVNDVLNWTPTAWEKTEK